MQPFTNQLNRLIGLLFILGPFLLLIAIIIFELGIGLNSDGFSSSVEGILGFYGAVCFVVIYLSSAKIIGNSKPTLGIIVFILGLLGASGAIVGYSYRVIIGIFDNSGITPEIMSSFMENRTSGEMMSIGITGLFFPLSSVLIGIVFQIIKHPAITKSTATTIFLAGVFFFLAEGTESEWGLKYSYPAAGLLWLIGFGRIGLSILKKRINVFQ